MVFNYLHMHADLLYSCHDLSVKYIYLAQTHSVTLKCQLDEATFAVSNMKYIKIYRVVRVACNFLELQPTFFKIEHVHLARCNFFLISMTH